MAQLSIIWIEAAASGSNTDWSQWNMFTMTVDGTKPAPPDTGLLLLPTVAKVQESKPFEEVVFIRDELANMVWGIETVVPLPNGWSGSGGDAFPDYFRKKGLGPLIGGRTWGGLIGISGMPNLIDGGAITAPTFRMYNQDGTWFKEGHGVDPDIAVDENLQDVHDEL